MMLKNALFRGFALFALISAVIATPSSAQFQPTPANPTDAIIASQTLSGTAPINSTLIPTNGAETLYIRILGTNAGLVATLQGTESRATSPAPTWQNMVGDKSGVGRLATVNGNGLYRFNAAGLAQVRLNITALSSGTVIMTGSASLGNQFTSFLQSTRQTYTASVTALVTAASATDFLTITGSATNTVEVNRVECSGVATTAATPDIVGVKRSTADTLGTSTAPTAVPHDSNSAAATAVLAAYTANPTLGTGVGNLKAEKLALPLAATGAAVQRLIWLFGQGYAEQPVILRGAAQQFAMNGNAATLGTAAQLDCSITWTEY